MDITRFGAVGTDITQSKQLYKQRKHTLEEKIKRGNLLRRADFRLKILYDRYVTIKRPRQVHEHFLRPGIIRGVCALRAGMDVGSPKEGGCSPKYILY